MVHGPREDTLPTMELFENRLRPIYERLSDPALFARCLPGFRDCAIIIRRGGGPKTRGVKIMERREGSTLDFSSKLRGGLN